MKADKRCGFFNWYPSFLQKYATTKAFIFVYGLLGTVQAMGYIYLVITLQTIEKRFKIPSQTTGIILSGNEISQILFSVILAYIGGNSNRPRFIAIGVYFCALSCFILALPHFIYGAGEDALKLTKEFVEASNITTIDNSVAIKMQRESDRLCLEEPMQKKCDTELEIILPLILIFFSQFVLGIGATLFFALGQTYLDDGVKKKKNTPILLGYMFALRTFGPAIGFVIGYACLKIYIDPTKTPLIDATDPRWMGAYWLGWIFIGFALMITATLVGMFPKNLRKPDPQDNANENGTMSSKDVKLREEAFPLNRKSEENPPSLENEEDLLTVGNLGKTLIRLFKNKLLMYNTLSAIAYILGNSVYFTYLSKYLEVQFHKSAADATIIVGPVTLLGMVIGFLGSGIFITKKKPSASKLLMFNVFIGCTYIMGQFCYLHLTCPDGKIPVVIENGRLNVSSACNTNCHCAGIPYTPVCLEETGDTFFNPCVASCKMYSKKRKAFYQCDCATYHLSMITPKMPTRTTTSRSHLKNDSNISAMHFDMINKDPSDVTTEGDIFTEILASTDSSTQMWIEDETDSSEDYYDFLSTEPSNARRKRSIDDDDDGDDEKFWGRLTPGACIEGCAFGFYAFAIISCIMNSFGCAGRIGNVLVTLRCVKVKDKSVTQGLLLMLISLFALIPGPILYGRIIDETCIVWSEQCSDHKGNCQLYDQKLFRYYINLTAMALTSVGVFFDFLVWKNARKLDFYADEEDHMLPQKENYQNDNSKK